MNVLLPLLASLVSLWSMLGLELEAKYSLEVRPRLRFEARLSIAWSVHVHSGMVASQVIDKGSVLLCFFLYLWSSQASDRSQKKSTLH